MEIFIFKNKIIHTIKHVLIILVQDTLDDFALTMSAGKFGQKSPFSIK